MVRGRGGVRGQLVRINGSGKAMVMLGGSQVGQRIDGQGLGFLCRKVWRLGFLGVELASFSQGL